MDLSIRLYAWRLHRGMTLQQVAKRSGIASKTLSKAECEQRGMKVDTLDRVVTKAFGIDLRRFFGAVPKVRPPGPRPGRPRTVSRPAFGALGR